MKNAIIQVTLFWMAPWLICCCTLILLHIEGNWLLKKTFATILPWKSTLSEKFQLFNAIDGWMLKMLKNIWISKTFICHKVLWVPNNDLTMGNYSAPHQLKASYVPGTKIFERRLTGNMQALPFQKLHESSSWAARNDAVQMFFSDTNQKHKHVFACVVLVYLFLMLVSWGLQNE